MVELRRRVTGAAGAADENTLRRRAVEIDRRVVHPGRDEQPQPRQPREHIAGERRPLAHGNDDVERLEPLDDFVRVAQMVGERLRLDVRRESRPEPGRDPLVIIEDRDPDRHAWVCGKPRSTFEVAGSGQREVTTFPRV